MAELIRVEIKDAVSVIHMISGENRFNLPFATALDEAIERAEGQSTPIVLTGAGKFFSNGLDLGWIGGEAGRMPTMMGALHRLLGRLLVATVPTAAAINGHAFGAGAILTAACDYRVMRRDRGYFCFPEVDLGLTFTDGFCALLQTKFGNDALHQGVTTGTRYGADDANRLGFVHEVAAEDQVLPVAVQRTGALVGKNSSALKRQLHAGAVRALLGE